MSGTYKVIGKYILYVLGVVGYIAIVQMLLLNKTIAHYQLILLLIPLIVLAYLFNTKPKYLGQSKPKLDSILSKRENEVAHCAAQGKLNKQIAEELFISENTVKTHIKSILHKLELKNRTQIAQWYYQKDTHPKG